MNIVIVDNKVSTLPSKVIRDGKVAVLISPGHGAGWSTWNDNDSRLVFDADMVSWVEGGMLGDPPNMSEKYPDIRDGYIYDGGAYDLVIHWVPVGTRFMIKEYDGSETLETLDQIAWFTA